MLVVMFGVAKCGPLAPLSLSLSLSLSASLLLKIMLFYLHSISLHVSQ